jgi:hypothetical protein
MKGDERVDPIGGPSITSVIRALAAESGTVC